MSASPSASVALPVRANGVRSGIVADAGAVTVGKELPVGVIRVGPPLLSTAPPLSVSPTNPLAPAVKPCSASVTGLLASASVPPNVTWQPVLLNPPPGEPATATGPPAGRSGVSAAVMPAAV